MMYVLMRFKIEAYVNFDREVRSEGGGQKWWLACEKIFLRTRPNFQFYVGFNVFGILVRQLNGDP